MAKIQINKLIVIILLTALSGCSSNVSGEWDCPMQEGHGCITIDKADHIAIQKVHYDEQNNSLKVLHTFRKVWFAPYTDQSGNKHEASVVTYYDSNESSKLMVKTDESLEKTPVTNLEDK